MNLIKDEKIFPGKQAIKISVIVPIYNAEKYLHRSLNSILNQTYRNLEIILVDDGSTDGSAEIMDEYLRRDDRVRVLHQTRNMGQTYTRKNGVKQAIGDYISYVDADDEISLTRYEELLPQMEAGTEIIMTDVVQIYSQHSRQQMINYLPEKTYNVEEIKSVILTSMVDVGHFHKRHLRTYVWGGVFARGLMLRGQECVADEIVMGEDTACFLWCLLYAKSFAIVSGAIYYYYKNVGSMCHISSFDAENQSKIKKSHVAYRKFIHEYLSHMPKKVRYVIGKQLRYELYYLMLVSDYKSLMEGRSHKTFFPFTVPITARVVLYGAGSFGQQFYEYWSARKEVQIHYWCDRSFEKYIDNGLEVSPPECILEANPDYVLLAIAQYDVAKKAAEDLIGMGVLREKIKFVDGNEF